MLDKINNNIQNKIKRNYKYISVFLLYLLYQIGFIPSIINAFGFNLYKLPKIPRLLTITITDLIYIALLLIMFKDKIKEGYADLKQNFKARVNISATCWAIGCIIMFISTTIISFIVKKDVSSNEALVRESIKLAPLYMLFTCSIVAPIFEEMVFRKALYGIIRKKWLFIVASGLSFGLLHVIGSYTSPLDFLYVIPYGAMGFSFAYLLTKTNNIILPILIHMIHNTILVISQILGG